MEEFAETWLSNTCKFRAGGLNLLEKEFALDYLAKFYCLIFKWLNSTSAQIGVLFEPFCEMNDGFSLSFFASFPRILHKFDIL